VTPADRWGEVLAKWMGLGILFGGGRGEVRGSVHLYQELLLFLSYLDIGQQFVSGVRDISFVSLYEGQTVIS